MVQVGLCCNPSGLHWGGMSHHMHMSRAGCMCLTREQKPHQRKPPPSLHIGCSAESASEYVMRALRRIIIPHHLLAGQRCAASRSAARRRGSGAATPACRRCGVVRSLSRAGRQCGQFARVAQSKSALTTFNTAPTAFEPQYLCTLSPH